MFGPISSYAASAAAARVPACRMPPPHAFRSRLHLEMNASAPTITDPTGAPRPLERHTETESAAATQRAGGTPSLAAAFHILAPSTWSAMECFAHSAPTWSTYARGSTLPPFLLCVFSRHTTVVRGKCWSSARMAPSIAFTSIVPSASVVSCLGCAPMSVASPPCSYCTMCDRSPQMYSEPRTSQCTPTATRFPIVPLGTKTAASFPKTRAIVSSSLCTVGSSPKTSSPTSARAIASRIFCVGRVTVSLRRSHIARRSRKRGGVESYDEGARETRAEVAESSEIDRER